MAGKRITIVEGHPDPAGGHFVQALADAYERAAREAGHEVKRIDVARLDFPLLHNAQEWEWQPPSEPIAAAQQALAWAEHLAIFYPLWHGDMPALLKGFFEQTLRPGFLEFCGIAPVRSTLIGMVEGSKDAREGWLTRLAVLGNQGS